MYGLSIYIQTYFNIISKQKCGKCCLIITICCVLQNDWL